MFVASWTDKCEAGSSLKSFFFQFGYFLIKIMLKSGEVSTYLDRVFYPKIGWVQKNLLNISKHAQANKYFSYVTV